MNRKIYTIASIVFSLFSVAAQPLSDTVGVGDPIFDLLTRDNLQASKSWVISGSPYLTGTGPTVNELPVYYNFPNGLYGDESFTKGFLNNAYTFKSDSIYIPNNQNVTVYHNYAYPFFGIVTNQGQNVAISDPNHKEAPFVLRKTNNGHGTQYVLNISQNSYLGYFVDANEYEIMKATSDTIRLRLLYRDNPLPEYPVRPLDTYFYFTLVKTNPVLGLQEENLQNQSIVYPNPASRKITLNTKLTDDFKLYNISGQLVLSQTLSSTQEIDIQELKAGLYHYTIGYQSGKLVIE